MGKFYLTTAIPYVNGKPHIGHALEYFQADTIRRFRTQQGDETLLLSGADENALKNVQAAESEEVPIQQFLDRNSAVFKNFYEFLGVHLDVFQRGSDQKKHWVGVQKLWELCRKNGDIYKRSYTGLYCVGCESFKIEKELKNGACPEHQKVPEKVTEENYFFRLSKYQNTLLGLIQRDELKISPENKKAEIISFIKDGLEDFSISRFKERAKGVGVPVPNDPNQVMYVWFDALAIYITGIGFGTDESLWKKWWPADLHVIGKDINRFHTIYWPAMLLSAKLPLPKGVLVHSFITSHGQKMSKTIGNVIDPYEAVKTYGLEPIRYYLLSQIPIDEDGDFTHERFKEVYNADLANGIGNLVSRVATLCEKNEVTVSQTVSHTSISLDQGGYHEHLSRYEFNLVLEEIWRDIKKLDVEINNKAPWTLSKEGVTPLLRHFVDKIRNIAHALKPFLPQTSEKIFDQFKGPKITSQKPLFPRR